MKDLALFCSTMVIFRVGFSVMKRVDEFIRKNLTEPNTEGRGTAPYR